MADEWRSARNDPPLEGVVVQVQNNDGALLKRRGRLWFFPDDSMYVYYTPEYWRLTSGDSGDRTT